MEIVDASLHQIDLDTNSITVRDIDAGGAALNEYIDKLLNDITVTSSRREFEFQSETKEVRLSLGRIMDGGEFSDEASVIGNRLLLTEVEAQKGVDKLGIKIPKGSLVQARVTDLDGKTKIVISKADHSEFLDETDFGRRRGLPWERKVFKAVVVTFDSNNSLQHVYVYDSNSSMAKYWWYSFLELREKNTDAFNTKTSLNSLDDKIFKPLKKDYPADYVVLRNSAIGYFRTKNEFDMNEFTQTLFENYHPINERFPIDRVKEKIPTVQESLRFDRRFTIDRNEIKKNFLSTKVWLRPNVNILFTDGVDIKQYVEPYEDAEGTKFVKIRVDEQGYKNFAG